MPVSPDFAMGLAKEVLEVYSTAEEILLAKIAKRLAAGIDEPRWYDLKLIEIQALRREVDQVLADLQEGSATAVDRALRIGYNRGVAAAGGDIAAGGVDVSIAFGRVDPRKVTALVQATGAQLDSTGLRIKRWADDVYRDVLTQTASQVTVGVETRLQAAQRAMRTYARRGVVGFTDRAGRSWDLATYAEMATRTAAAQAAVQGHVDKLTESGYQLVIVSNAPEECKICRPWEGKVLALSGPVGAIERQHATRDGETVRIDVAGTLAEATRAGLFHPNCRHSTSLYLPGVTKVPTDTEDPQGDQLRQQQRAMERSVRANKRDLAMVKAMHDGYEGPPPNPLAGELWKKRDAVRESQSDLRDFIDEFDRKNLAYRTSLRAR